MSPCVALEVKGVIEAFAAEGAEITLDLTVALDMAVEQSLEREDLAAHGALELVVRGLDACGRNNQKIPSFQTPVLQIRNAMIKRI